MSKSWIMIFLMYGAFLGEGCQNSKKHESFTIFDDIRFIKIPGGAFLPGDPSDKESLPQETITISTFYMSSSEVTVAQYATFLNEQSRVTAEKHPQFIYKDSHYLPRRGVKKHALTHISYTEAGVFCNWLSQKLKKHITLPSEHEWEYAARAGTHQAPYAWGWGNPSSRASWNLNRQTAVNKFNANNFGLYDMSGGVYEWCLMNNTNLEEAIARGGAWSETDPSFISIFKRTFFSVEYRGADVGFRLVYHAKQH